jgi:lysine-ketoglutarate reductase/saccharopine dehydrogenase-like protein (TIGR00300 family)
MERPKQSTFRQIASEIIQIKKNGGKIVIVAGPAVVHTKGTESLAWLISEGYVDVLLSGNALAVHDVEYALFGTSLGMKLDEVELAPEGHKNHIYAISEVWKCGSLEKAVEMGVLKKGIMFECVRGNVEYILAGSIRDDGPMPGVITDAMKAQDAYRDAVQDVDLVLMLSTTLHSIAVGNCLRSTIRTICVDINPTVVQKLMDRGTAQAMSVVTDVGVFLPMLVDEIKKQR